jgi:hypothetical protein
MQQPADRSNSPICLYNPLYSSYFERLGASLEIENDADRMGTRSLQWING